MEGRHDGCANPILPVAAATIGHAIDPAPAGMSRHAAPAAELQRLLALFQAGRTADMARLAQALAGQAAAPAAGPDAAVPAS